MIDGQNHETDDGLTSLDPRADVCAGTWNTGKQLPVRWEILRLK